MLTTSPSLDRTKQKKMPVCVTSTCVMSICATSSCVMSVCVCVCGVNLCDVKLCDVNLCDVNLCDVKLCDVNLCDVNLCDVKLCDVNLCDVNLCDVKLCDVSVRVCDVNLCGVCLCDVKLCDVSVRVCVMSICVVSVCVMSIRRQTRVPAGHQRKIFATTLSTARPRTQFTHSTPPNPRASRTSTQNVRSSYWHSYPERNLHTASRQTRMPAGHQRNIFATTLSTARPRMQFTHSTPPNPHASRTSTQNFRSSYWHSYPERNLHTASRRTRMPGRHQRKIFATPVGTATRNASPTPATQTSSDKRGGPRTPKRTSDPLPMPPAPRLPRKRPAASPAAREHQSVHQTPCRCRKPHACHANVQRQARRPANTKAYIRPPADAASPTPATQTSSDKHGGPRTPKRTSDPLQMPQVPRLPRKRPATTAAAREHQSVHQTPCRCRKPHACHANVQRPDRRPANTKAYIRPPADAASPTPATQTSAAREHQSVHQTPCRCRKCLGGPRTPKRTSDPLQMPQVPRLPRKRPAKPPPRPASSNVMSSCVMCVCV